MATPESKTKNLVKKVLDPLVGFGLYYFMPSQGKFSKGGVPDFIICYMGQFIGVETKADGKLDNTTKLQKKALQDIKDSSGISMVIENQHGVNELENILKNIKNNG